MQQPFIPPVSYKDHIFDTCFHPLQDVLATAHVGGTVQLYSITDNGASRLTSVELHESSVTKFKFFSNGQYGVTASSDGTCCVIDTNLNSVWQSVACLDDAENDVVPISALCVPENDSNVFIAGDESGAISVWDTRMKASKSEGPPIEITEHEDTISDMVLHPSGIELISISADGTLGHFDLRKGGLVAMSDPDEDEMLFVNLMRGGKKVVVGCDSGKMKIFSWGDFGDFNDLLVGHPPYLGCHIKIDERLMLTGAGDRVVRLTSVCPNKMIGALAVHEHEDFEGTGTGHEDEGMIDDEEDDDTGGLPLESLCMNYTKDIIATTAHDDKIKFFRVGNIINEARRVNQADFDRADRDEDDSKHDKKDDNKENDNGGNKEKKSKLVKGNKSVGELRRDEFFSDL